MYFPIMGRNLFCWLLGWGLCMYAGLVFRGASFGGRKGKEKEKETHL